QDTQTLDRVDDPRCSFGLLRCEIRGDQKAFGPVEQACRHSVVLCDREPLKVEGGGVSNVWTSLTLEILERPLLVFGTIGFLPCCPLLAPDTACFGAQKLTRKLFPTKYPASRCAHCGESR